MQINAGIFNKKIQVIRYEIIKDSDGFETKTEIMVLNTWAQVTNISGTEVLRSNSDFSEVKTRFLIRTPKTEITKDNFCFLSHKARQNLHCPCGCELKSGCGLCTPISAITLPCDHKGGVATIGLCRRPDGTIWRCG